MNDKLYNEILRESSIDTKYKPLEKSPNKDIHILVGGVLLVVIGLIGIIIGIII